jgi:hypothetical protein
MLTIEVFAAVLPIMYLYAVNTKYLCMVDINISNKVWIKIIILKVIINILQQNSSRTVYSLFDNMYCNEKLAEFAD